MWTILLYLLFLILGALAMIILFLLLVFYAFKPDPPEIQLKIFGDNLLDFEFGKGYEVIESMSQNNHPDRPQDLKIKLSDEEYEKLRAHIDTLAEGEVRTDKGYYAYIRTITKRENGCSVKYASIQSSCSYQFFEASAEVDYPSKIVSFHCSNI